MIVLLSDLLGRTGDDIELTPSPETEETGNNRVEHDQAALSMAEIASCSYEARYSKIFIYVSPGSYEFKAVNLLYVYYRLYVKIDTYLYRRAGVRNGMFFGQAKQLCPELQSVPYDFHAYKEVALAMYETLARYTTLTQRVLISDMLTISTSVLHYAVINAHSGFCSYTYNIEALSCDEALLDATSLLAELGVTPDELATAIRADVREKTGCCASVGMSEQAVFN